MLFIADSRSTIRLTVPPRNDPLSLCRPYIYVTAVCCIDLSFAQHLSEIERKARAFVHDISEVLMAVNVNIACIWDVTPCSLMNRSLRSEGICVIHHSLCYQDEMAETFSETSVRTG